LEICRKIFVDTNPEIDVYGKLKITICAPIAGLPEIGFFMRKSRKRDLRAGDRAGLFSRARLRAPRGMSGFPVIRLLFNPGVQRPWVLTALRRRHPDRAGTKS